MIDHVDAVSRYTEPGALVPVDRQTTVQLVAALSERDKRIADLQNLVDRLKLEAQIHAGEARGANATIHEAYQAVTESKGEPGSWNGAVPIKDELERLRTRLASAEKAGERMREALKEAEDMLLWAKASFDDAGRYSAGDVMDRCVTEIRVLSEGGRDGQ